MTDSPTWLQTNLFQTTSTFVAWLNIIRRCISSFTASDTIASVAWIQSCKLKRLFNIKLHSKGKWQFFWFLKPKYSSKNSFFFHLTKISKPAVWIQTTIEKISRGLALTNLPRQQYTGPNTTIMWKSSWMHISNSFDLAILKRKQSKHLAIKVKIVK